MIELVNILSFVLPQFFLSPALVSFFTATTHNEIMKNDKVQRARKMISLFILRRNKQMVLADLPSKTNKVLWCDMSEAQSLIYLSIQQEADDAGADYMTIMTDMRKCANHPLLLKQ